MDECNDMRGNSTSELSQQVQKVKVELGINLFKERHKQLKTKITAEKI